MKYGPPHALQHAVHQRAGARDASVVVVLLSLHLLVLLGGEEGIPWLLVAMLVGRLVCVLAGLEDRSLRARIGKTATMLLVTSIHILERRLGQRRLYERLRGGRHGHESVYDTPRHVTPVPLPTP